MNRIWRVVIALLILIAISYGIWWQLSRNRARQEAQLELTTTEIGFSPVSVAVADSATLLDSFRVNGSFQARREVVVVSTVNGQIEAVYARPGDYVSKGKKLVQVDDDYTRNELEAAQLNLEKAERDVARLEKLVGEGGVTQSQYEEAKVKLESGKIKVKSLKKRLDDSSIEAPISGNISPIPRNPVPEVGGYVGQGKPLYQIVDVSRVRLKVLLTQEQIVKVREGLPVRLRADVYPGRKFEGRVTFIGVKPEVFSSRYPVKIEMQNPADAPIRSGMNGQALFTIGSPATNLAVPREAFPGSVREGVVYVVLDSIARRRPVEVGNIYANRVEILSGLRPGERVITAGHINVSDSTKVRIVQ